MPEEALQCPHSSSAGRTCALVGAPSELRSRSHLGPEDSVSLRPQATPVPKPVTITIEPERILDTRVNLGLAGAFAQNTPRDVQVTGSVDVATLTGTSNKTVVPTGASAVLVNVTVVAPTDQGFLTLRPSGATAEPSTSTVNFFAGSIEPNAATVDLSADGKIQVWVFMPGASATANVLIDVVGYTVDHNHDDRYYTEGETDTMLGSKANTAEVYTKAQVDAAVAPKANSADVYTKAQVDAAIAASSGVAWASADASVELTGTAQQLLTVNIVAPADGFITVR